VKGANAVNSIRQTNVKMLAAVIGGSAVVAMGALAMAINQEQASSPATLTSSGMTVGVTSTQETPPTAPATSLAVPVVKATPFGGAGS
jgi:hypothetical protein